MYDGCLSWLRELLAATISRESHIIILPGKSRKKLRRDFQRVHEPDDLVIEPKIYFTSTGACSLLLNMGFNINQILSNIHEMYFDKGKI